MSPYTLCLTFRLRLSSLSPRCLPFGLVEMTGLEPVNPLLAKQVLSQLSYTPTFPPLRVMLPKTLKIEQRINFFKSLPFP